MSHALQVSWPTARWANRDPNDRPLPPRGGAAEASAEQTLRGRWRPHPKELESRRSLLTVLRTQWPARVRPISRKARKAGPLVVYRTLRDRPRGAKGAQF